MGPPRLVAHRGWPLHYPENTLPGVEAALRAGTAFLEVDVQLSADGAAVLFHDRTLARVCGVPGAIHSRTLAELRQLSAAEERRLGTVFRNTPIATLAELVERLAEVSRVHTFVELKRASIEVHGLEAVLSVVLSELAPLRNRTTVISFDREAIRRARACGWPSVGWILERWGEIEPLADVLFVNHEKTPREARLDELGVPLAVYETVDPQLARQLGDRGASYVETFAIGEMLQALGAARTDAGQKSPKGHYSGKPR